MGATGSRYAAGGGWLGLIRGAGSCSRSTKMVLRLDTWTVELDAVKRKFWVRAAVFGNHELSRIFFSLKSLLFFLRNFLNYLL